MRAHEVTTPENQPQVSQMTMGQYYLHKIKAKQVFNAFTKFQLQKKFFLLTE